MPSSSFFIPIVIPFHTTVNPICHNRISQVHRSCHITRGRKHRKFKIRKIDFNGDVYVKSRFLFSHGNAGTTIEIDVYNRATELSNAALRNKQFDSAYTYLTGAYLSMIQVLKQMRVSMTPLASVSMKVFVCVSNVITH
jgi:hypothetical protein